jgi:uncharacterized protein involved in oxidation of intracellular sulfur
LGVVVPQPGVQQLNTLLIFNDPPYGTERTYNGLRLAQTLLRKNAAMQLSVFLLADAVAAARKGQKTAEGFYNVEHMLKRLIASNARVLLCGTCMDARGIQENDLIEGAKRSSMDDLAQATLAADKVIAF